jgi:hypothetical protein
MTERAEGPLVPYIAALAEQMRLQGYSKISVGNATRIVADFSGWLKQKNIAKEDISISKERRCGDLEAALESAP